MFRSNAPAARRQDAARPSFPITIDDPEAAQAALEQLGALRCQSALPESNPFTWEEADDWVVSADVSAWDWPEWTDQVSFGLTEDDHA